MHSQCDMDCIKNGDGYKSCIFLQSFFLLMSLKTAKISYWVATIALALFTLPWLFFMGSEAAVEWMKHVGLTDAVWLQQLIGFWAPLAILLILIPKIPNRLKEWAYVGIGCIYIGAFWAHVQLGDPISAIAMPVVTFAILLVSYLGWHRMMESGK